MRATKSRFPVCARRLPTRRGHRSGTRRPDRRRLHRRNARRRAHASAPCTGRTRRRSSRSCAPPIAAASISRGSSAWSAACRRCPAPKCARATCCGCLASRKMWRGPRACSARPKFPSNMTDFVYLGGGLVIGILIGMVTVPLAGVPLSLGQRGRLAVGPRLRLAAFQAADVRQVPAGGVADPEGPRTCPSTSPRSG